MATINDLKIDDFIIENGVNIIKENAYLPYWYVLYVIGNNYVTNRGITFGSSSLDLNSKYGFEKRHNSNIKDDYLVNIIKNTADIDSNIPNDIDFSVLCSDYVEYEGKFKDVIYKIRFCFVNDQIMGIAYFPFIDIKEFVTGRKCIIECTQFFNLNNEIFSFTEEITTELKYGNTNKISIYYPKITNKRKELLNIYNKCIKKMQLLPEKYKKKLEKISMKMKATIKDIDNFYSEYKNIMQRFGIKYGY